MTAPRIPTTLTGLGLVMALALAACSEQPTEGPPTEQEIHAGDSAVPSRAPGRHPYRCDDGRELLVDYLDKGLTIELRRDERTAPIVLTAPMQGLQYLGGHESATLLGSELIIETTGRAKVICKKQTTE